VQFIVLPLSICTVCLIITFTYYCRHFHIIVSPLYVNNISYIFVANSRALCAFVYFTKTNKFKVKSHKMFFKQMPTINTTIRSPIYNDTAYCMHSLIRDKALKRCQQIPNADLSERAAQILWQVNKKFKKGFIFVRELK
jgi:hypothetical protein